MTRSRRQRSRVRDIARARVCRGVFERLEDRRLLAAEITWIGANGASWTQPSNWNLGRVPAVGDDVVIPDVPGEQLVQFPNGRIQINSLRLAERLNITGGTLEVVGNVPGGNVWGSGTVQLASNGTVKGASLSATTQLVTAGGTLNGVTVNGSFTVNRGSLTVSGGLTLNGQMALGSADGSVNGSLNLSGTQTLGGTGTITYGGSASNSISATGSGSTLTIGSGITIHGVQGALRSGTVGSVSVINQGTINVPQGGDFTLGGNSWKNLGAINVDRGTIQLDGSFKTADLGAFNAATATVKLVGVMDNSGATFRLQPSLGGDWWLSGGTIRGGTVSAAGSEALVLTREGGTLEGVTVSAAIDGSRATSSIARNSLEVLNGLTLNGPMRLGNQDGSRYTQVIFTGTQTLGGTGTVTMGGSASNSLELAVVGVGQPPTLTIGERITIEAGSGSLAATGSFPNTVRSVVNLGTIRVGAGGDFTLGVTTWRNEGVIDVAGGTINLGGSFTTAGLGTFTAATGTVNLTGVMDNTGATFTMAPAIGGNWRLDGGTIRGGNIAAEGSAKLVLANRVGKLDGVTILASATIDGTVRDTATINRLNVINGLVLDGAMWVGPEGGSGVHYAQVEFAETQTLGGSGTILFGSSQNNSIYAAAPRLGTATLTVGSGITIWGGGGSLTTSGSFSNSTEAVIHQGTIDVPTGRTFTLGGLNWRNDGTINANGNLLIGKSGAVMTNTGTLNLGAASTSTVTGAFTQTATGTLKTTLGGTVTGQYGRVIVSGAASLAGRFEVGLVPGYSPAVTNSFTVMSYGSRNGEFSDYVGLNFAPPKLFQPGYSPLKFTLTAALDPNAAPDLVVVSPSITPQSPRTGDQVTLQWQVRNRGSAPTAGSWTDRIEIIQLSSGVVIAAGDVAYNASTRGPLPNGQNASQSFTFSLPHSLRGVGDLQARITTDVLDTIRENFEGAVGETNNRTDFDFTSTLANYPDLQVDNLNFVTSPIRTGQEATVRWSTANRGTAVTTGGWRERVVVSQIATGRTIAWRDLIHDGPAIAVGGVSAARNFTFTVPDGDLGIGPLRVRVTTDFDDQIIELNATDSAESNNVASATADAVIGPYPELSVGSVQVPALASLGTPFTVSWTVLNSGNAPLVRSISDRIYLSTDPVLGGSDRLLATVKADPWLPVAIGANYTGSVSVTLPRDETVAAGEYFIIVVTDALADQFEVNEADNRLVSSKVSVLADALSDLVVTDIATAAEVIAGRPVSVTWTLKNEGIAPASGPWQDRIFYSTDGVIGGDEPLDSLPFTGTLNPGQSVTRTQTVRFPSGFSGSTRIVVRTDALGSVMELDNNNNATIDDQPIVVLVPPPPNLVVSSITSPSTGFSGQDVTVRWQVSNIGQGETGGSGWVDRVYLSRDGVVDANDLLLGSLFSPGLGGLGEGESYSNQLTVALPQGIEDSYRFIVVTDAGDRVQETGAEDDNRRVSDPIEVALTPPPDLVVSGVLALPTEPFAGQQVTVGWTVTNQGVGPASALGWSDRLYVSFNGDQWDPSDTWLATVARFGQLGVGQSYTVEGLKVRLPAGVSGEAFLIVRTDTADEVYEHGLEGNNASSVALSVSAAPSPDLTVRSITVPDQAFAGQPFMVAFTVANEGPGSTVVGSWYDSVYLSPTATLEPATARLLGTRHRTGVLGSGQSERHAYTFQLADTLSGSYFVIVATDATNRVREADDDNNLVAANAPTAITFAPPDLVVSDVTAPPTALSGQDLTVRYTVTNRGATPTSKGTWYDTITLSADGTPRAGDPILSRIWRTGVLAPGQSETRSVTLRLPDDRVGTFTLLVTTDASDLVYELDEGNNHDEAPLRIDDNRPDLVVADFQPRMGDGAVLPGASRSFDYVVENRGPGAVVRGSWTDRLILSADDIVGNADDVLLASSFGAGTLLVGGTSERKGVNFSIPESIPAGNYRLFLRTDAGDNVAESIESNNVSVGVPLTVAVPPDGSRVADLQVTSVSAPATARSGEVITVAWNVANLGTAPTVSSSWFDAVWLSRDGVLDSGDIRLGSFSRSAALDPGASYSRTAEFELDIDLSGDYSVIVQTDVRNSVFEGVNEGNNRSVSSPATSISLSPTADLRVEDVAAPTEATAGGSLIVSWTVVNDGAGLAEGNWYDGVYLSPSRDFDPARGVRLGFVPRGGASLAAGGRYTATGTFTIPSGIVGDFHVVVVTNAGRRIYERGGEGNNAGASVDAVAIASQPLADLVVAEISTATAGTPGREFPITFTVRNEGAHAAQGRWSDAVYISADDHWDVGDVLVGSVSRGGPVPAGGSYTSTLNAALPGVLPGDYKVIVRTDIRNRLPESDEANNVSASLVGFAANVPALTLGSAASGMLRRGEVAYYRVDVEADQTLVIEFDSPSASGFTELYASFGAMPRRGLADFSAVEAFRKGQRIVIPITRGGTYYILAQGTGFGSAPRDYRIGASVVEFAVLDGDFGDIGATNTSLFADRRPGEDLGSRNTIKIVGSKFTGLTTAALVRGDTVIPATSYWLADGSTLHATFDLPAFGVLDGFGTGLYDLRVADPAGGSITVPGSVNVVPNARNQGRLSVRFEGADRVRADGTHPVAVRIGNDSTADTYAPLITLRPRQPGTLFGVSPQGLSGEAYQFLGISGAGLGGVYAPGDTGVFHFYFAAGAPEVGLDMGVVTAEDRTPIDWGPLRDSLRPPTITAESWPAIFENLTASISTWGDYVIMLNQSAIALGQLGQRVSDLSTLWGFQVRQAMNAVGPVARLGSAVDGYIGLPGLSLGLDRSFSVNLADRNAVGLFGRGWSSSWDTILEQAADGTIRIGGAGGAGRLFMPVAAEPGRYIGRFGETGVLTFGDGFWRLRETSGLITSFRADGRIDYLEDAGGHRVTAGFVLGRLTSLSHSSGQTLTITNNLAGRPVTVTDGAGRVTRYAYDAGGERLLSVTTPEGITTVYTYQTAGAAQVVGALISITTSGESLSFTYDARGRLVTTSRGGVNLVSYAYGTSGRVDVVDGTGSTSLFHDARGLLVRTQDRFGRITIIDPPTSGIDWHELGGGGLLFGAMGPFGGSGPLGGVGEWVGASYAPALTAQNSTEINTILGPEGTGDQRWVSAAAPLSYTIRFGNDPTMVNAPSQVVRITQTLDANLDPRSFRLGSFGFGGLLFEVPEDRADYATRLDLRASLGIFVDVVAGIDIVQGTIEWSFTAIDPWTGDVPIDWQVGFLPADAFAAQGDGFVSYTIRVRQGVATGARIAAAASVVIDQGIPVATVPTFNLLDAANPETTVIDIQEFGGRYRVRWAGSDGDGGSGIARYDLYVSENEGPFTLWLDDTALTEAEFVGIAGRRYTFYSIGYDRVGNIGTGSANRNHDYGDAPLPYPVTIADNGARHQVGSLYLGAGVATQVDGIPDSNASWDAEDNGVRLITTLISSATPTTSSFAVMASGSGRLDAWIDFNQDGDWNDAGEQVLISADVTAGLNVMPFTIPALSNVGRTVARFRLSSAGGLAPSGAASDGEVEDYVFVIQDARGATPPDVSIDLPVGGVFQLVTVDQRVVVRVEGRDLFSASLDAVGAVQIVASDQDDVLELGDFAGTYSFDSGGGDDALRLITQGRVIDLTRALQELPRGIGTIDVRGTGPNRVILDPASVVAMGPWPRPLRLVHDGDDVIAYGQGWRVDQPFFDGSVFIHVLVTQTVRIEIENANSLQNPFVAFDVDRDGEIEPLDALIVLNALSRASGGLGVVRPVPGTDLLRHLYTDVSGDGIVTPFDALLVLNALGRRNLNGEGEQTPTGAALFESDLLEAELFAAEASSARPIGAPLGSTVRAFGDREQSGWEADAEPGFAALAPRATRFGEGDTATGQAWPTDAIDRLFAEWGTAPATDTDDESDSEDVPAWVATLR